MRKRRKIGGFIPHRLAIVIFLPVLVIVLAYSIIHNFAKPDISDATMKRIEDFAEKHELKIKDWPDNIIAMLDKNPEAEEFVLNYPLKKDKNTDISIEEYVNTENVPLMMQWDERWGYTEYSG